MEFTKEKIVFNIILGGDMITDSYISIPDYVTSVFWDGFRNCILSSKSLPVKKPDIFLDYEIYDNKDCYAQISLRALRSRTKGRRSVLFYTEQLNQLADCKDDYMMSVKEKVNSALQEIK